MIKALNFGSGMDIKKSTKNIFWDNLDIDNKMGANIICNLNEFPYNILNNTYDYIYSSNVLEHLIDKEKVLNELCRIAKPNAIIEIIVPHLNCEGAFADMGHISFFCEKTFETFYNPPNWREQKYKIEVLKLESIPSSFGKWIYPKWIRRKLSLLLRGIFQEIRFKFKVIK
jgi:SAM-dependent methyltransferase